MNNEEYRSTLLEISKRHGKKVPGAKYIHKWDMYMLEKQFCVDNMNFEGVNSVLEIGCGMGMLAYLIREQKGITDIELTDVDEFFDHTDKGGLYKDCCDVLGLKRFVMYVNMNEPMKLDRQYDMIVATRTVFDRECLEPGTIFNYEYWFDDCFKYCKRVFVKTNFAGGGKSFPDYLRPYLWWPTGPNGESLGKPRRGWYIRVDKEQWENR